MQRTNFVGHGLLISEGQANKNKQFTPNRILKFTCTQINFIRFWFL